MGSRKISIQVGKGKGAKHRKRGSSSFAGRFHGQDERGLGSLALAETRKAAEGGDAASQCLMAKACLQGAGCARDAQAGAAWYRRAAEQGSAEGWFGLFSCAIQGLGMPKDDAEAFRACERAAELGHLDAMANMGLLVLNGTGCQADPARSREWLEKAAEQDSAEAQYNLSCQLFREVADRAARGEAVEAVNGFQSGAAERDAMFWLHKAAQQDLPEAVIGLARKLYARGAWSEEAARPGGWLERAADFGNAWASFELGQLRWHYAQSPQKKKEALARLLAAARAGMPHAEYLVGNLAVTGQAPGLFRREGLAWLKKAAAHGVEQAKIILELEEAEGSGSR
ncbi:MAG: sel1 repeat family protein [Desulfovibrio sp.]|nr:sel1 repeat family protein [Desulfovibrio sp.]